ncbi:MAG: epoxyqueuosine reductase QueH [Lachnospiraceae bacterium]|nr:epoxyqueuosine reductase QueH [Lachnospiraceae bacterium]
MDKNERKNTPKLLLHVCCAPCSSHVLELLENEFNITVFFYNPNITYEYEYKKRLEELYRFISEAPFTSKVQILDGGYEPNLFFDIARGMEDEPERGGRCYECYKLRMRATAKLAKSQGYNIFTTSLSISPHKNATWINDIGFDLSKEFEIDYLYSDFKKKNGYARSIELSREFNLYRQDYCGCIFSKKEAEKRRDKNLENNYKI